MKKTKELNLNRIKKQQFFKYSSFAIPENILEEIFEEVDFYKDENDVIFNFNIKVGEFIIEQIKNDNIDIEINVIDNFAYLKKLIIKNSKYELSKEEIDKVYEEAIDNLKISYNINELLSTNIVTNMKKIILGKDNLKEKAAKNQFDISFLKEYIELYEIDKKVYASAFDISEDEFQNLLDGNKKMNNEDLYLLCSLFGVDTYDHLKMVVKDKIEFHKQKEKLIRQRELLKKQIKEENKKREKNIIKEEKIVEEIPEIKIIPKEDLKVIKDDITRYNLSFVKEYALLYNVSTKDLANRFHCGISKVDEILNGKLLIKETIIDDIAYEFGANNFDDMYEKITNKIKTKRENIIAKSLKKTKQN